MVNPYNHQDHVFSKSRPENLAFLERLRALTDEYDARGCLGEIGDAQRGLEIMGQYTEGNKRMHMCYAFDFLEPTPATAGWINNTFGKMEAVAANAWPCWAFSNHDVERHTSRWALGDAAHKAYATLMMCLRGSACLYQGEELGLQEADVAFEDLQDPYGIEFWPEYKGRDGCRTPMVWSSGAENGGFSEARPWLPVSKAQLSAAVDRQESDPHSSLHHYRQTIALRHAHLALMTGDQTEMAADGDLLTFSRSYGAEQIFCAFNLGDSKVEAHLPTGKWSDAAALLGGAVAPTDSTVSLGPWQYCIAIREAE